MTYSKLKKQVHLLLDPVNGGTNLDKAVNIFIVGLISLNTLAVILETVKGIYEPHKKYFDLFETSSVVVFSIEYILRVWSCTETPKYKAPLTGRIRYIFSTGAIIDLLAVMPFYLPAIFRVDLRVLRLLRIMRFVRLLKLGRYAKATSVIAGVIKERKSELFLSAVVSMLLVLIASTLMYFTEHDAQPEKFSSIPETMWWSVSTLTTVGYGDVVPITSWGKTLAAFISILGIGMFALPAGILASGFSEEIKKSKRTKPVCPHCGKEVGN